MGVCILITYSKHNSFGKTKYEVPETSTLQLGEISGTCGGGLTVAWQLRVVREADPRGHCPQQFLNFC
jgi:hypothetical protein